MAPCADLKTKKVLVCSFYLLCNFFHSHFFQAKCAHISKDPIDISDGDEPARFLSPIPSPGVAVADAINRVKFSFIFYYEFS